jgi:hypothetical protein
MRRGEGGFLVVVGGLCQKVEVQVVRSRGAASPHQIKDLWLEGSADSADEGGFCIVDSTKKRIGGFRKKGGHLLYLH